jgi:hypothetical protein
MTTSYPSTTSYPLATPYARKGLPRASDFYEDEVEAHAAISSHDSDEENQQYTDEPDSSNAETPSEVPSENPEQKRQEAVG